MEQINSVIIWELSDDLKNYTLDNFDKIFALSHDNDVCQSVLVYDKEQDKHVEKKIFRKFKSYLNTPSFDSTVKKSYMFRGTNNTNINENIPDSIKCLYDFVQSSKYGPFNQCTVNWYDKNDYIETHSDCTAKLVPNSNILIMTLSDIPVVKTQYDGMYYISEHYFEIYNKEKTQMIHKIGLLHGNIIIMSTKYNENHHHGVPLGDGRRISISFRNVQL